MYLPPEQLKPYEKNTRKHSPTDIEQIKASIEADGFNDPIGIWSDDNIIIEGHGRQIAAIEMGLKTVPCIRLDHLTDTQRRDYAIRHNRTAELSDWDLSNLEEEIARLEIEGVDLSGLNFDFGEAFEEGSVPQEQQEKTEFKYFTDEEIENAIVSNWKTYASARAMAENMIDEASAMFQFNRLCQGYNEGYNISLLFNPHRLDTETQKSKSLLYGFNNDPKYKKQLARFMTEVKQKVQPPCEYYKYITAGSAGYQYVNEFQPYMARDIYKRFCKNGDRILNPCAGWGGRLLGIASCMFKDIEYVETDPQPETYRGLVRLKKFLCLGDNFKQFNLPFEELEVKENYFDFVFTSPPYFDTERYGNEDTQSYKRYNSFEKWTSGFLIPMLDKILFCLKRGGNCLLNVGNVKYNIDGAIENYLDSKSVGHKRINDFKIGGTGIGDRTGEDGEPFILFWK